MEILKPGGGMSADGSAHTWNTEENMRMLWDTAREYGRY